MGSIRKVYREMIEKDLEENKKIKRDIISFSESQNLEKFDDDVRLNILELVTKETKYRENLKIEITKRREEK